MYFFVVSAVLLLSATCNGQSANAVRNPLCKSRNMYVSVDGKCDTYVECRDYQAFDMECPDGLNFNPEVQWPFYPCGYPQDVPCGARLTSRPAQPTADCARQHGYFKSPLANELDCGHYRLCNGGVAFEMYCPAGLAFDADTARCDWPENVPGCNVENYIGFTCPAATFDEGGFAIITNHRYEDSCYAFYSCVNGRARILSCDSGLSFNPASGRCEDSDRVNCEGRPGATRSQIY